MFGPEYQRIGTLEQNGGGLTNDEGTEATVNSPENVEALTFVKDMMKDGGRGALRRRRRLGR